MTIQVMLQIEASGNNYSLESGLADNIKNFDHHKEEHRHYPSPSNNAAITPIEDGIIEISHIDADTYIGLLRFYGEKLPDIDLNLVEQIDLNGSSICEDLYDETLLYVVGLTSLARRLEFPRCSIQPQDVTTYIEDLMRFSQKEILILGKLSTDEIEKAYKKCGIARFNEIALYSVDENDSFDPSRPYKDGIDIAVVYRQHYQSISIYCNPKSKYTFAGQNFLNIAFAGHPKACGSPRRVQYSIEDATNLYKELIKTLH